MQNSNQGTPMFLLSEQQLKNVVMAAVEEAVGNAMREAKDMYEAEHSKTATIKASEVTERYGISSTTLWRWSNSGVLTPVKVCGHNRYRVADVERVMNGNV